MLFTWYDSFSFHVGYFVQCTFLMLLCRLIADGNIIQTSAFLKLILSGNTLALPIYKTLWVGSANLRAEIARYCRGIRQITLTFFPK